MTPAALVARGVDIELDGFRYAGARKRKIDCNAVYTLLDEGLWWSLLTGKRMAIVSGHADEFATRLIDAAFVKATGGGEVTWSIATVVSCPTVGVLRSTKAIPRATVSRPTVRLRLGPAAVFGRIALCDRL